MIQLSDVYNPMFLEKDKTIILITGGRGCEKPTQEVIMSDLSVKMIKDVRVGESLMGDDFTPRRVLATHSGRSAMFHIRQTSGEDYMVNDGHILTLKKSKSAIREGRYAEYPEITDIKVTDLVGKSRKFKEHFRGFKAGSIPYKHTDCPIEPYFLGLWLGDGTSINTQITTPDKEIVDYIGDYAERLGLNLTINGERGQARTYRLSRREGKLNPLLEEMKKLGIVANKHIPQSYISNSESVRLELLAGLLDTDGNMHMNGYEITQKSERLARQIKFVADSLGFRTSINAKEHVRCSGKDCGTYWRVMINGDVWRIPCRIARKKVTADMCHKNKDWRLSQIEIESAGEGEWVGVVLDGNQRYLHSDGTVTHNSGKSYATGTFIERLTFESKPKTDNPSELASHVILYTRYTMVSAAISVIPEFTEKIDLDGTTKYFNATKGDIENTLTGGRILFRGIRTSSGNQTAKLKSIHGITTFVVDEAEEWTSEAEFDTIMLSIRQKDMHNRIIIIMNPTDSNHFVYRKFIKDTHKMVDYDGVPVQISTHPNVLHIHTTYLDNKANLSPQFLEEIGRMKTENPEKYAHIVMGQWADVSEGAIFKNWGIVDEFPEYARHIAVGVDFGFSCDKTAICRCGIVDNRLYIEECCYKTHMLIADLVAELKKFGRIKVIADSADPRLIQEIFNAGILIYPVQKGGGSIMAGIEKMKDMELFVTKNSVNLQNELRNYVWDKDKDGNYINYPVDRDNHCFTADTLVMTDKGEKPIADIKIGDKVLTSDGFRQVTRFFANGCKKILRVRLKLANFMVEIKGTPDHKVKTSDGWKELQHIQARDILFRCESSSATPCEVLSVETLTGLSAEVFDIEVAEMHEFFANGILVHNCIDSARYYVLGELLGRIVKPLNTRNKTFDIF